MLGILATLFTLPFHIFIPTISGGQLNRIGIYVVPIPLVTNINVFSTLKSP